MKVEVTDNSELFKQELADKLPRALEAVGLQAEANAKIEITRAVYDTPEARSGYRRTGNLRNSISHVADDSRAYVGTNIEYAPYVEMGTSKYPYPRPFLRPAVENYIDEYKAIFEEYLKG